MGFKRKRDAGHEFRPRLSPADQLAFRIRRGIAQIGEPSKYARDTLLGSLAQDLKQAHRDTYPEILQIIRAVVYEQPHKIGYLSFLLIAADTLGPEPFDFTFLVLEMAHDELSRAIVAADYERFKVYLRFLASLAPVIENVDALTTAIHDLVTRAQDPAIELELRVQLFKSALLAALYLPESTVTPELQQKFAETEFPELVAEGKYDFFFGPDSPYKTQSTGFLLTEAARSLKSSGWEIDFLASNPISAQPSGTSSASPADGLPAKPAVKSNPTPIADELDSYEPAGAEEEHEAARDRDAEEPAAADPESITANADPAGEGETAEAGAAVSRPAPKHRLRPIHVPTLLGAPQMPLHPLPFCRIYVPSSPDARLTVPAPGDVFGLLLRDVATDAIRNMDFNRREVTRQLIALDVFFRQSAFAAPGIPFDAIADIPEGEATLKVEDIALEAVYSQMFDLSRSSRRLPTVYYDGLLIDACIMAPQAVAPVLGRALRFLFNHLATADAEILFTAVNWFAHHVSNFAFTWKWNEWVAALDEDRSHPQQVFIRELLAKQVRLSYPQRVRDVLPEEFQTLVPNTPDMPPYKYAEDERALRLIDALQMPAKVEDGAEGEDPATVLRGIEDPAVRSDILITTICHLGNRSVTHATNWISKTEDLVREFVQDDRAIIASVLDHWDQAKWVGALVVRQFIRADLATARTFVDFVAGNQDLLLSSVGWETLHSYPGDAREALASVEVDGPFGDWWVSRLRKVFDRRCEDDKAVELAEDVMQVDRASTQPAEGVTDSPQPTSSTDSAQVATATTEQATPEQPVADQPPVDNEVAAAASTDVVDGDDGRDAEEPDTKRRKPNESELHADHAVGSRADQDEAASSAVTDTPAEGNDNN